MRDVSACALERLSRSAETLFRFFGQHGYQMINTPLLEETELFVRKSGGELTSRLHTFVDPGGRVISLRPEFTPSVIRHYIEHGGAQGEASRWQYCGPVLRYEDEAPTSYRQFTQAGAELVGASGVEADAEVLWLAWSGLAEVGVEGHRLRVGHVGVLHDLIRSYGLSEAAKLFIISNVQALKARGTDAASLVEQARAIGLLPGDDEAAIVTPAAVEGDAARGLLQQVLREVTSAPFGRRSPEQVAERLLRKVGEADEPEEFRAAVDAVNELAKLEGRADAVLEQARAVVADSHRPTLLDDLGDVVVALAAHGVPEAEIVLDLGLAMGISYYTGFIFEITTDGTAATALASGGRYDDLVKALGGDDEVPASGFAYNLEHAVDVMAAEAPNS